MKDLFGLEKLPGLTALTLNLGGSQVKDLSGLELTKLASFSINLRDSPIQSLSALKDLTSVKDLELITPASLLPSFQPDEKLRGATKLTLAITSTDQHIAIPPGSNRLAHSIEPRGRGEGTRTAKTTGCQLASTKAIRSLNPEQGAVGMSCVPIVAVRQLKILDREPSKSSRTATGFAPPNRALSTIPSTSYPRRTQPHTASAVRAPSLGRGKKHSSPGGFQDLPVLRIALAAVGALSASASHFLRHRHADIVVIICCIS